jgi:hypothetical protein
VIAQVEQFVEFETFFAYRILLHVNLQPLPALLQVRKSGLTHEPDSHNASGNTYIDAWTFQLFGGLVRVIRDNLRNRMGGLVFRWVNLLTERFNLFASRAAVRRSSRQVPKVPYLIALAGEQRL